MVYQTAQDSTGARTIAGPFTLREAVVIGGGLLLLLGSVLPFQFGGLPVNIWVFNGLVFNQLVSLALPVLVAGAFAWRRLTGRTRVVVGSLTLDQLASVVAVLTVLYFFLGVVLTMNASFLLGLLGALALLAGTTAASVIPGFAQDFQNGEGHVLTRPVRPSRPRAERAPSGDAEESGAAAPRSAAVAAGSDGPGEAGAARKAEPAALSTASEGSPMPAQDASAWQSAAAAPAAPGPTGDQPARGQSEPARTASDARATPPEEAVPLDAAPLDAASRKDSDSLDNAAPRDDADSLHTAAPLDAATALGDVVPRGGATPSSDPGGAAGEARVVGASSGGRGQDDTPAPHEAGAGDTRHDAHTADAHTADAHTAVAHPVDTGTPAAGARADGSSAAGATTGGDATPVDRDGQDTDDEPFEATRSGDEAPAYQAFWFAVPRPREVVDERSGRQVFTAEPGAWILALEDRGDEFLVQDTDGRVGVLRDLTNVERA
ncbi:MAG: hypothetical protein ABWX68_05095 [Arthrobacter sp.]|uniref:hypothetical protein n=1 Tax=Arthrobacter sp. TaxID=1667 RepID=UPI0034844EA1